ncbi:MAG TPA: hypothetical protein VF262_02325 [Burkholderiales bacterium]|jgi:hypothetical protein
MDSCEIFFVKTAGGWKWRPVDDDNQPAGKPSAETYQLFYDCIVAARSHGFRPNIRCL